MSSFTYWMLALPIPYLSVLVVDEIAAELEEYGSYDPTARQKRWSDVASRFVQSGFTQSSKEPVSN